MTCAGKANGCLTSALLWLRPWLSEFYCLLHKPRAVTVQVLVVPAPVHAPNTCRHCSSTFGSGL